MGCCGKADQISRAVTQHYKEGHRILSEWFGKIYPIVRNPAQGLHKINEAAEFGGKGDSIGYVYAIVNPFSFGKNVQKEDFDEKNFVFGQVVYVGSTTAGAARIQQHWKGSSGKLASYVQRHRPFSLMWQVVMWEFSTYNRRLHIGKDGEWVSSVFKLEEIERQIRGFLNPVLPY
jgi:hypothetical protein